jgi:hypothetical protein
MAEDINNPKAIDAFISTIAPDLSELVNAIRAIILNIDPVIGEQIKWNSPSFLYTGRMKPFDAKTYKRDMAVMHLNKGNVMLVFPNGADLPNIAGILEGNYTDGRRMITINDLDELNKKKRTLEELVQAWLEITLEENL